MQKINAYTLMEVTVAMLLSTLTITICYSAYGIINSYFNSFQQKNTMSSELLSLKHTLDRDAERSDYVFKTANGFEFSQDSAKIAYAFTNHYILRQLNDLHTDTFKIQLKEMKSYFEGKEMNGLDTIDQINFKLIVPNDIAISMQINKYYSATDLFK